MTTYNPQSSTGPGIQVTIGPGDVVDVASNVVIVSTQSQAINETDYGSANINGSVKGVFGLDFSGGFVNGTDNFSIASTGLVQGSAFGISVDENSSILTNSGSLIATDSNGIAYSGNTNSGLTQHIINYGTISGNTAISYGGHGTLTIVNSGTIDGTDAILFNGSNDSTLTVRNTGTIDGSVSLGGGKRTVFDSSQGKVFGTISTGVSSSVPSEVIAGLNGGTVIGIGGNDNFQANQSQTAADNGAHFTLDGGGGTNALYGGGAFNTFMAGDANGGFNQIHGGASLMTSVTGYANNTLSFSSTPTGESVRVDLRDGHNAYVNSNSANTGTYTLEDAIANVPNIIGSSGKDIVQADNGTDRIQGGAGADSLYAGNGFDTFVYSGYADSNTSSGYDTVVGFKTGIDKIDMTALASSASHLVIQTGLHSTALYLESSVGHFSSATDLAINFVGANAIKSSDVVF